MRKVFFFILWAPSNGRRDSQGFPAHTLRTTVLGYWKGEEIKREVATALEISTETSFLKHTEMKKEPKNLPQMAAPTGRSNSLAGGKGSRSGGTGLKMPACRDRPHTVQEQSARKSRKSRLSGKTESQEVSGDTKTLQKGSEGQGSHCSWFLNIATRRQYCKCYPKRGDSFNKWITFF